MTTSGKYSFDKLQLYFGDPYFIPYEGGKIEVLQPTIGDMLNIGESQFYQTLYIFIANTTMLRLQLWDIGQDWNKISDYELFCARMQAINPGVSQILFKNIDFSGFKLHEKRLEENSITTLYNPSQDIEINEETYTHIAQYLRTMFNIFPKVEKTKGKTMKEWLIEEEREKLKTLQNDEPKSTMLPLISSYLNHPGTKYKKNELREVGIYEFMDSIQRLRIYESTIALTHGMYSGMISVKDMKPEAFDFMREK